METTGARLPIDASELRWYCHISSLNVCMPNIYTPIYT